eukprot:GABV01001672.1.p3 GENE.GABV01001672.1~~GABV01001672.1.p3  ORF type:complete len:222 (-),score=83.45 GABV01001672.1:87-752(-)
MPFRPMSRPKLVTGVVVGAECVGSCGGEKERCGYVANDVGRRECKCQEVPCVPERRAVRIRVRTGLESIERMRLLCPAIVKVLAEDKSRRDFAGNLQCPPAEEFVKEIGGESGQVELPDGSVLPAREVTVTLWIVVPCDRADLTAAFNGVLKELKDSGETPAEWTEALGAYGMDRAQVVEFEEFGQQQPETTKEDASAAVGLKSTVAVGLVTMMAALVLAF